MTCDCGAAEATEANVAHSMPHRNGLSIIQQCQHHDGCILSIIIISIISADGQEKGWMTPLISMGQCQGRDIFDVVLLRAKQHAISSHARRFDVQLWKCDERYAQRELLLCIMHNDLCEFFFVLHEFVAFFCGCREVLNRKVSK